MSTPSPLAPVRPLFRAVTRATVPLSSELDGAGWDQAEARVARSLSRRPPSVVRQVLLFYRVLDVLARLRSFRGLASLPPDRVERLLRSLERAPVLLLRRGVWGVRTLAFMGVYTQPGMRHRLGYDARLRGWAERKAPGAWPERKGAAGPEAGVVMAGRPERVALPVGHPPLPAADARVPIADPQSEGPDG